MDLEPPEGGTSSGPPHVKEGNLTLQSGTHEGTVSHYHARIDVFHPDNRTQLHLAIRRDQPRCGTAHQLRMMAIGFVMAAITCTTVLVPPLHMYRALYP